MARAIRAQHRRQIVPGPTAQACRATQGANDALSSDFDAGMTDANSYACSGCGERFFDDDLDHDFEECIEGGALAFLMSLCDDCDDEVAA